MRWGGCKVYNIWYCHLFTANNAISFGQSKSLEVPTYITAMLVESYVYGGEQTHSWLMISGQRRIAQTELQCPVSVLEEDKPPPEASVSGLFPLSWLRPHACFAELSVHVYGEVGRNRTAIKKVYATLKGFSSGGGNKVLKISPIVQNFL